jgi:hypothetical protein
MNHYNGGTHTRSPGWCPELGVGQTRTGTHIRVTNGDRARTLDTPASIPCFFFPLQAGVATFVSPPEPVFATQFTTLMMNGESNVGKYHLHSSTPRLPGRLRCCVWLWRDGAKPEASDGKELGHEAQSVGLGI